ncbi:MAG: porin [Anaeromyxobacteraceae bacterium]
MPLCSLAAALLLAQTPAPFAAKVTPYGFINFQYSRLYPSQPKPGVNTFEFRRARLGLKGDVTPNVAFNVVYDGADSALKDAWITLKGLPGVEARLGQFKTPFGHEQQESDTKLLWLNNSYVVAALARGKDSRDEGAIVNGKWTLGPVAVDAATAYVNGAGPNAKDDLDDKGVWARAGVATTVAGVTPRLGVSYGYGHQVAALGADAKLGLQGTGATATFDDTTFYFHAAGLDLTIDSPWFFAVYEAVQSRRHVTKHTNPTTLAVTNIVPEGWYAGVYGKTPWNAGPVLRVEEARLPTAAATAVNAQYNRRTTLGAYYDVAPLSARFVANYEWDRSPPAIRTGNRLILLAQVLY